jgi:hypothetical protein
LAVTGLANFQAGANDITLDNAASHNFGTLQFAGAAVTVTENSATTLSGANTATSLALTSAGAISDGAAATLAVTGLANFQAGANDITLDNAASHNFGTLQFAGAAVTVTENSATTLSGASTATSLALTSAGAISDGAAATLAVTGLANFQAGANDITLDNAAAHNFGTLQFAGAAVTVTENSATTLSGASTATSLALTSAGAISDGAAATLAVTGLANFQAGANDITLDNAAAHNFGTLQFAGAAVTVTENSATTLSGASTATSLALTSAGAISDGAAATLAVTGLANFQAGANNITLDNAAAHNFGTLQFAGAAVTVTENSATTLSGANTATSLALTSAGAISDGAAATLAVTGLANFQAGANDITLDNAAAHNFGTLQFAGAAVTVTENSATTLSGANTATSLALTSAGAIDDGAAATLAVTGLANFQAGLNNITLDNAAAHNFGTLQFAGAAVTVAEASAMALAGASTANTLSLVSAGAITQPSGSVTANTLTLGAGGAMTLNQANQVGALTVAATGGAVQFTDAIALTVQGITAAGAGCDVTLTGVGSPTLSLPGNVNMGGAAGNKLSLIGWGTVNQAAGATVSLKQLVVQSSGNVSFNNSGNVIDELAGRGPGSGDFTLLANGGAPGNAPKWMNSSIDGVNGVTRWSRISINGISGNVLANQTALATAFNMPTLGGASLSLESSPTEYASQTEDQFGAGAQGMNSLQVPPEEDESGKKVTKVVPPSKYLSGGQ